MATLLSSLGGQRMPSLQRMSGDRSAPGLTRRLQVWWALRSQKRRRESQNQVPVVPPVPVITGATVIWDGSEPGYADVSISWRIDYGASPVGSIEVLDRKSTRLNSS